MAARNNGQVLHHANGAAAIDQLIATVGAADKAYPGTDRRTVSIDAQYLRADQIPQLRAEGILPALSPMHTFYRGDWPSQSVAGPHRAEFISPTAAVYQAGMQFGIHSDAPVVFPNSMRVLDAAVNRTTRSGFVLGPAPRLLPVVALKPITFWPGCPNFQAKTKGSLEIRKRADMLIMSANPLITARTIGKDIKVVETIKDYVRVYTAP